MIHSIWNSIYINYDKSNIMYMTLIVLFITEIPIFLFTLLDILKLDSLKKYRIRYNSERVYPTNDELLHVFKESYKSFFKIYIPLFISSCILFNNIDWYPYKITKQLPDSIYIIIELFLICVLGDILFNLLHRLFHIPYLYKKFHKKHHEYKYTFALVHHYLHDFEALIFILPAIIPPILFNSHIMIMWIWMCIAQFMGIIGHSGYFLPSPIYKLLPTLRSDYHDAHHYLYNKNFGLIFIHIDKILGTYYY